jgi:hypothetical protein
MWLGISLASRNVTIPDRETAQSQVLYGDAWLAGVKVTEAYVDEYLVPLEAIFIALGILAVSHDFRRRSREDGGSRDAQ